MKRTVIQVMIGILAMTMLLSSCRNEELEVQPLNPEVPEGYVNVSFRVNQSDMNEVEVRSVDPDGQDINFMTLFCFNAYGLYLANVTDVELTLDPAPDSNGHNTSGIYTASIPAETAIIHFVANQSPYYYQGKDFVNKTEAQVLGAMEGASGMMIYWARFEKDEQAGTDLKTQLLALNGNGGIKLIRNQAKITITDWKAKWNATSSHDKGGFSVTGYVTANVHAFGTIAPFCHIHGFAIYNWPVADGHYGVTLAENKAMMSDITDINTKSEDYIFEHENTLDNPVSVIIKGRHDGETKDLYYRAMIMDNQTGDMIPILRNHHYKISIVGPLSYGKETFEEALNGPATNNVWVSVDSWVKEVVDSDYKLTLVETSKVFHDDKAGLAYAFRYTLKKMNNSQTPLTAPEVSWLAGNNVAMNYFSHSFNPATGEGSISVTLLEDDPNVPEQKGTLMIRKGRLYRTIDISMISKQKFTPAWIAAQVYGQEVGENVTLKFTIPETCPKSLFPFPVMITANNLDVRSAAGRELPIRLPEEASWYGEQNQTGYKYEYIVDGPGVHRVYFHSILPHGDNVKDSVILEANYFERLKKEVIFVNHTKTIRLLDVYKYQENAGPGFAKDDSLMYCLVPQKKNAYIKFGMYLVEMNEKDNLADDRNLQALENDEFFVYSKYLDFYPGNSVTLNGQTINFDCEFGRVDEETWASSSNGRFAVFRPKERAQTGNEVVQNRKDYAIHMFTTRPASQDVIRIASNTQDLKSYWGAGARYSGEVYRSVIFELRNYRPFRLAAQVKYGNGNYEGTYKSSQVTDEEEDTNDIYWDYDAPGQPVDIAFDVTSFQSITDGKSVDPFGTKFKIYIDAPMLTIDDSRRGPVLTEDKFYEESEGRFVYKVAADRTIERAFGQDGVKNVDATEGVSQNGERKILPFKTKEITTMGDILISSEKDIITYYDKKFRVRNNLIKGTIQFKDAAGNIHYVPKDAFVSFVRKLTNTRIGSITVNEAGKYQLNLRKEYTFYWTNEEIEFNYKDRTSGISYDLKVPSLDALKDNPNIVLEVATETRNE